MSLAADAETPTFEPRTASYAAPVFTPPTATVTEPPAPTVIGAPRCCQLAVWPASVSVTLAGALSDHAYSTSSTGEAIDQL